MRTISHAEALGKMDLISGIDKGIEKALLNFIRIAYTLSLDTSNSCEGHIDWKYPFPNIDFKMNYTELVISPRWKLWKWRSRQIHLEAMRKIRKTLELRMTAAIAFLTDEIIEFYSSEHYPPEMMFHAHRTGRLEFCLMPTFPEHSRMLRQRGGYKELELLLTEQRKHLTLLSEYLLKKLYSSYYSLEGVEKIGCPTCRAAE